MKKLYIFLIITCSTFVTFSQQWEWARLLQTSAGQIYDPQFISDKNGNLYLKAFTYTTCVFEGYNVSSGTFLAKYNTAGQVIWAKSIPGAKKIKLDAQGGIHVVGSFSNSISLPPFNFTSTGENDIYYAKINSIGQAVSMKTFGGLKGDEGNGIEVGADKKIHLTGTFTDSISFDTKKLKDTLGKGTFYLVCMDSSLNVKWASTSKAKYTAGYNIVSDINKNVYAWGKYLDTCQETCYGGSFMNKYDSLGNRLKIYTNNDIDSYYNLEVYGSELFLHGYGCNHQYCTNVLYKYDLDLNPHGYKYLGISYDYSLGQSAPFAAGEKIMAGSLGSWAEEDSIKVDSCWIQKKGKQTDILIAKMDTAGNFKWFLTTGGIWNEGIEAVTMDESSNIYVFGYIAHYDGIANYVPFGSQTLVGNGNHEQQSFIAKINQTVASIHEKSIDPVLNLVIYPNPSQGIINVKFAYHTEGASLKVLNVLGEPVQTDITKKEDGYQIELKNNLSGIYFLEASTQGGKISRKLVIK